MLLVIMPCQKQGSAKMKVNQNALVIELAAVSLKPVPCAISALSRSGIVGLNASALIKVPAMDAYSVYPIKRRTS
jgi:hypothetical protein